MNAKSGREMVMENQEMVMEKYSVGTLRFERNVQFLSFQKVTLFAPFAYRTETTFCAYTPTTLITSTLLSRPSSASS